MAAYYHEAEAGRRPCPPYVNTSRAATLYKMQTADVVSQQEYREYSSQECGSFLDLYSQLVGLFVRAEDETAASVRSEDRRKIGEVRASSWSHSSPHLTLCAYTCTLYYILIV